MPNVRLEYSSIIAFLRMTLEILDDLVREKITQSQELFDTLSPAYVNATEWTINTQASL